MPLTPEQRQTIAEWVQGGRGAYLDPIANEDVLDALWAEREEMLSLLREVEWVEDEVRGMVCPFCQGQRPRTGVEYAVDPPVGHASDCRLSALLRTP